MLQPFHQQLDDRRGDRVVYLPNDADKLSDFHGGQLRSVEAIDLVAECSLTESGTMAARARPLGDEWCNCPLCAFGHRLQIPPDILVSELLDDAFHCNIHGFPAELHFYFPRLAIQ
ncbi:hypothetical protein D3C71_1188060 [compost metagenome]